MRKVGLCWLVWATLAVPRLFACEARPLELREVTPDVTLLVTHRGAPIAGIEIKIFRLKNTVPVFTGITNEQGTILHKRLAPGQYHVYASHEGFDAQTEWIEVVGRRQAGLSGKIEIQWADWSYESSRVAGTLTGLIPGNTGNRLMDIVHPVPTMYPGVALELKQAFSGEELRTLSDSSGAFLFPDVADGVYVLTVAGGMTSVRGTPDATRLIVDVKKNSASSSLPLELRDNGCGGIEFQLKER